MIGEKYRIRTHNMRLNGDKEKLIANKISIA